MPIVDHGVPVRTARQWTTGVSPNAAGDGWNYIVDYVTGPHPHQWCVIKNLTTAPAPTTYETLQSIYANTTIGLNTKHGQLRAQNGRIFFPQVKGYTAYYDPIDEQVHQLGPIVETPPIDPNASTIFYAASFDTTGRYLYYTTQESHNRPSCIAVVDTEALTMDVLGYVGSGALSYTTYGKAIAPDTITASKFIYVAYGENPWQLWALDITNPAAPIATKLYEVSSTGNIQFLNVDGQGWVAIMDTNIGQPDNVRVQKWCLSGALYDYVQGVPPPAGLARNVTPATNPLVGAPQIDNTGGAGVVGWRNGASGPYTVVNYEINYATPIAIESLVPYSRGIAGNTAGYNGFINDDAVSGTTTWFGPYSLISQGPGLNVDGIVYRAGYPNGVLIAYEPTQDWQTNINPTLIGYYAVNGTQNAGIKYTDFMTWASSSGSSGRLYVAGERERNGVGSGIGGWTRGTTQFFGTYAAAGMDSVLPDGLCDVSDISRVVMSTHIITPPGTASLYVFDYSLNLVETIQPFVGQSSLGEIYETQTPSVITGILQGSGNSLRLWQYNIATHTLLNDIEIPIIGSLGPQTRVDGTHRVYLMMDDTLVRVDINALTAVAIEDLSSIAPVSVMSMGGDGSTMYFAGGVNDGVSGAQLFSLAIQDVLAAGTLLGAGSFADAALSNDGDVVLVAGAFAGNGTINPVAFDIIGTAVARTGDNVVSLQNDEGTQIAFGQPLVASGNGRIRLASADDIATARVIGIVCDSTIEALVFGRVSLAGIMNGTTDQWDIVCGTSGGLTPGTVYYLDTVAGHLRSVPPASGQLVPVIRAISTTQAKIAIKPPVSL